MGYWTAGDITINDLQGNQRFEGRNDCVWNMYLGNPLEDLETPTYESGSLNYLVTDTIIEGHHVQKLNVRFKVKDNVGVETGVLRLAKGGDTYSFGDQWGDYDKKTQTLSIDYLITEYFPTADYYVESFDVADSAGNFRSVWFSDSPTQEKRKSIPFCCFCWEVPCFFWATPLPRPLLPGRTLFSVPGRWLPLGCWLPFSS